MTDRTTFEDQSDRGTRLDTIRGRIG